MVIVVMADGPYANATSLADFSGARITAQIGTTHYDMVDQIPGVDKQGALLDFPNMVNSLKSGFIDGYVAERPSGLSAVRAHPDVKFVAFEAGSGFNYDPDESNVSVGMRKGSDLLEKVNEALAKISNDDRQRLMTEAIANSAED
jgi:ABC-type amino acid transport substrate-binding protein